MTRPGFGRWSVSRQEHESIPCNIQYDQEATDTTRRHERHIARRTSKREHPIVSLTGFCAAGRARIQRKLVRDIAVAVCVGIPGAREPSFRVRRVARVQDRENSISVRQAGLDDAG